MNKTLVVLRNEVLTTVSRRSFLLLALGVPLLMTAVTLALWFVNRPGSMATGESANRPQTDQIEGYVDHSGIIAALPPDVSPAKLLRFADEQQANLALQQGAISAYYVVPRDYIDAGKIYYVHPQANLTTPAKTAMVMRWVLLVNLLGGDVERAARVWNPMHLKVTALAPQQRSEMDNADFFMLPYAVVLGFYIVVLMSGSLLRNSMGEERKNRVQEILLTSAGSLQLLLGKITALGIVGLVQTVLWASVAVVALRVMGQTTVLPAGLRLPASMIAWMAIFFVLGYAVYGSLLAGLGALTGPNTPGSSSADFVVVWPAIIPLFFWAPIVDDPGSALAIILSLFPLTSPVAMLMRLIAGSVPGWQLLLAVGLLVLAAYLIIRGVATMFRAQNLLSGQAFSLRRYLALLLGRT